ncbi:MAG: hypothetical protein KME07_06440 [Pegethrix bostrychoides GSE-TBD4-15B]|jgi:chromosome segregation ATPase|uniref:Uncharacterized protein n=1 Tax=Pegethrix bostrychoides GSE-TBD4-15B TaxID=2839662 RepID=A0A951P9D0_9CYAN|nr:hypothetical protein [Pegethrix bostrychoides GSE-TBD4-15B]
MTTELEQRVSSIEGTLDRLARLQEQNQMQLNETSTRLHQLTMRVDSFVFESQRLFARLGERAESNTAAVDSLRESVTRLTQTAEADRTQSRATTERMDSMISRLDRLVDYLMQQGT